MKIRSIVIGLLAGLLFGIATPLSKILLSDFNSFQLAGLLYFGAAIAFSPFIIKHRKIEFSALKQTGKKIYLVGVIFFGGILGPLFLMIGLNAANAMSVSIWLNMEMVATAILGVLIFKDYMDRYAVIGVFSYGISIVLYVISAQNLGATRSQILFSTAPFWGISAAWIFLNEPLNLIVLISFSLLVSGIIFTNLTSHGHPHYHKGIVHFHLHSHDDGHHYHIHEGVSEKGLKHSHLHEHKEIKHTHKHCPDLHHRHEH